MASPGFGVRGHDDRGANIDATKAPSGAGYVRGVPSPAVSGNISRLTSVCERKLSCLTPALVAAAVEIGATGPRTFDPPTLAGSVKMSITHSTLLLVSPTHTSQNILLIGHCNRQKA